MTEHPRNRGHRVMVHTACDPRTARWVTGYPRPSLTADLHEAYEYTQAAMRLVIPKLMRKVTRDQVITVL